MSITNFRRRAPLIAMGLALALSGGYISRFTPLADAALAPVAGVVELSPTPPNLTQSVAPNIVMTFDDSGSMNWSRMSDYPPFTTTNAGNLIAGLPDWSGGPWRCANVYDPDHPLVADAATRAMPMNGVYYNPNITYTPPTYADGTSFPNAGDSTWTPTNIKYLDAVWVDGIAVNKPRGAVTNTGAIAYNNNPDLDYPTSSSRTNVTGTKVGGADNRWKCGTGGSNQGSEDGWNGTSPMDGAVHTLSDGTQVTYLNGGPYYYRLKTTVTVAVNADGVPTAAGLTTLYTAGNWEAVPVPAGQYQNFANWYAYYRTRNQMARSSISRVFGQLASATPSGQYGSNIRVAWQNLNTGTYKLPAGAIISELLDSAGCVPANADPQATQQPVVLTTPPPCYRSAFYNWLFQVPASGSTPTRSAMDRAGQFFKRGKGVLNLKNPYWQPAQGVVQARELYCRQNFHMLVTDGLWNIDAASPARANLTLPAGGLKLPDNTVFPATGGANSVTSIYAPQADAGGAASLSDIAFSYWATDLRPDLYGPALVPANNNQYVAPYLPDQTTGVTPGAGNTGSTITATNINQEIYFNPNNDPATWPHMSEYLVGLGVSGQLLYSTDTDCIKGAGDTSDACLLRKGSKNSSGLVGWPQPNGAGSGIAANIDDTWHAALAGRGNFFSAGNPQQLVDQLSSILSSISKRSTQAPTSGTNASVLTTGAISFSTAFDSTDWSGSFQAVTLNSDGTSSGTVWNANTNLDAAVPASRQILTGSVNGGVFKGMPFEPASSFDAAESAGLMTPASVDPVNDTQATRVNYLRGDKTEETNGKMRQRKTLLGAIIDAQPVYVSYPSSGYNSTWPAGSPEAAVGAQTYDAFVTKNANRAGTVYVGANDGMLHAFDASLACSKPNPAPPPACLSYGPAQSATAGNELWAYVPRAVYGNLGNLTSKTNFNFQQTVNATPVVRDVFFSDQFWHTILVGGLRLGGRGVYALDITDPSAVTEATASSKVLWEFDSDNAATPGCASVQGTSVSGSCQPSDLGYTYGQPNVGRLANGKWVVIVSSGYFPDCSKTDKPSNCAANAAQAPKDGAGNSYSALFVLDAQTGAQIAELKTPTNTVASYGLSSPVLGDYNNDQIDDVAYAGDLAGNLWRFDLTDPSPANWKVTLAYQPTTQGAQPITVMPRLFPDPSTNRFMVVFGTGRYLGTGDNVANSEPTQAVYGIRDKLDGSGNPQLVSGIGNLVQQMLGEQPAAGPPDIVNAILRTLTTNLVPSNFDGWYFNLDLPSAPGERVTVTPAALFNTNTAVISTLIPGGNDPCNPSVTGAAMFVDAPTGGAGNGVSQLGGGNFVGALVNNVRTSGSLPVATAIGGGKVYLPGLTLLNGVGAGKQLPPGDTPIWRRRSWAEVQQ